jgi:hypothetical protein
MREIARLTGHGVSTVFRTISRFKKKNSLNSLPRSGRPIFLNESDRRYLKLCAVRDRRKILSILTEDFNIERKFPVSNSVVNCSLHSLGMMGHVACRKPLLSSRNVIKRLRFARQHVGWSKKQWISMDSYFDKVEIEILETSCLLKF